VLSNDGCCVDCVCQFLGEEEVRQVMEALTEALLHNTHEQVPHRPPIGRTPLIERSYSARQA
jgi:hypothetical protein